MEVGGGGSGASAAGDSAGPDSAGASVAAELVLVAPGSNTMTRCWFEWSARLFRAEGQCVNIGSTRYPRYACHACAAARRALPAQARDSKELRDELASQKASAPAEYKARVRRCRIRQCASEVGVASLAERREAIGKMAAEVSARTAVRGEVTIPWLTERQFIAHHVFVEGMSREEATAQWASAVDDPAVQKRGAGQELRCATLSVPTTTAERTRAREVSVSASHGVDSASEQSAMRRLALFANASGSASSSGFAELGGAPFALGAAMSVAGPAITDAATAFPTAAAENPRSVIAPVEQAADCASGTAPPKRGLGRTDSAASAPGPPPGKSRRSRRKAGDAEVSGVVAEARQAASAELKAANAKYLAGHNNPMTAALALRAKGSVDEEDWKAMEPVIAIFKCCADAVKEVQNSVGQWTADVLEYRNTSMASAIEAVAGAHERLWFHVRSVRAQAKSKARDRAKAAREGKRAASAATREWAANGVPDVWCEWLYGLGVMKPASGGAGGAASSADADAATSAAAYTPSQPVTASAEPDWQQPQWFDRSTPCGFCFAHLHEAIGTERLAAVGEKLGAYLASEAWAMCFLKPRGGGKDQVEALEWLPPALLKASGPPEAMRTFGGPWLLAQKPRHARHGAKFNPFPGVGQCLLCLSGPVLAVTWAFKPLANAGVMGPAMWDFVSNWTVAKLAAFLQADGAHFLLREGASAWLPYGHHAVFFSVGQGPVAKLLMMPVVSVPLASAVPDVSFKALVHWWNDFAEKASGPPWDALVGEALDWAKTCEAARPHASARGGPLALADAQEPQSGPVVEEGSPPARASASAASAAAEGPPPAEASAAETVRDTDAAQEEAAPPGNTAGEEEDGVVID
ncbi:MAG: hypothetical protein GY772_21100 [bacterium]|nr:hypothetical protein [bacterium]